MSFWPLDPKNKKIYMVGIKGTGMTALAELLVQRGAQVSGSDVEDVFYTDTILRELHIPVFQGFSPKNVPDEVDIVVHSSAYDPLVHSELLVVRERGLPLLEYTEALGEYSRGLDSSGVSGVHGKTTTTALVGTLVKGLGLHGSVLAGSAVSNFGGRSTLVQGNDFFVAETCEYRRHFLHFHPNRIILTSVELDHQDYFRDLEDIKSAFFEYVSRLPEGGTLIYCADDAGACEVAARLSASRHDVALVPYGFSAEGGYRISDYSLEDESQKWHLAGLLDPESKKPVDLVLRVPGKHNVLNATAALALVTSIYVDRVGSISRKIVAGMTNSLAAFRGSKRRSEVLGQTHGVLFMDDYAHHPTAIRTTLEGFRDFFPTRRIVVDFMSHTYSRTAALLEEFSASFTAADRVILHEIYPSAREKYDGSVNGELLFQKTRSHNGDVLYFPKPADARDYLEKNLMPGDLFVTMGAGDNWKLGKSLYDDWRGASGDGDDGASA